MMASSSAMTTRVANGLLRVGGSALRLGQQPVEELVLGALEVAQLVQDSGAVAPHGVGVAPRLLVLTTRHRRLAHERLDAQVVGRLLEGGELLVRHGQLLPEGAQARRDLVEAALQQGPGHGAKCRWRGADWPSSCAGCSCSPSSGAGR